jgi:hypothetical protein
MSTLYSNFHNHQGRVIHKWTHYFPAYERHFAKFVDRPVNMLEIGVFEGGSLQMWKQYFGPAARIVGIDIDPVRKFQEGQITVEIGDQSDPEFLASLNRRYGPFDVVLDDGSHRMEDMAATFRHLYPLMSPAGVYAVEDMHTCYWESYEGGLRRDGTFIEICKGLIDELNADQSEGAVEVTDFSRTTTSMHFYPSMAFFERGRPLPREDPKFGTPPPRYRGRRFTDRWARRG